MEQYVYLLLSLSFLLLWIVIYCIRPDLQRRMWKVSIVGGVAGVLAEIWYFRDYWRPPTIVGTGVFSPEDILVGFAITGICATIYEVIFHKHPMRITKPQHCIFLMMFLASVLLMMIVVRMGYNSEIASCIIFVGCTIAILAMRPDLLLSSVMTSLICAMLVIPIYYILFGVIAPHFWNKYWLLHKTPLGFMVLPGLPATELLWYVSWGLFMGCAWHFLKGTALCTQRKIETCNE